MIICLGWPSPATSSSLPAASLTSLEASGLSVRVAPRRLFGLAPTGGYRATAVASGAVGSYPTVSPLPLRPCGSRAVCSLWPLSVALRRPGVTWQSTLWSSDFPRAPCGTRDHHT